MKYAYDTVSSYLKQALRKRRISYADLAQRLGMSESGVKKAMANDDISLARLAEICEAAGIDLLDLLEVAWKAPPEPFYLNDDQRALFASSRDCYLFHAALLAARLDVEAVKERYGLDQRSVTLYLGALEDVGLISADPSGRLRSAVPPPHRMGGIPAELSNQLLREFLEHSFAVEPGRRRMARAQIRMTAEHLTSFKAELQAVVLRFGMLAQQDELTRADDRLVDVGVLTIIAECANHEFLPIARITRKPRLQYQRAS